MIIPFYVLKAAVSECEAEGDSFVEFTQFIDDNGLLSYHVDYYASFIDALNGDFDFLR